MDFFINLNQFRFLPKATFEIRCCPKEFSIFSPSTSWSLKWLINGFWIWAASISWLVVSFVKERASYNIYSVGIRRVLAKRH